MALKIFLDVNIIVDFFDKSRISHPESKVLMTLIENDDISGYLSESVVNTSVYLLQKGFPLSVLKDNISELVTLLPVLPCTSNTVRQAYLLPTNDLEDAVLYQIAFENNLDYFVTSDRIAYKRISSASLPVITAKELIKLVV